MQPDRAPTGCTCPIATCVLTKFTPPLLYCKCGQQATRPINCKCPAKTHKLVILDPMATCVKLGGGGGGDSNCAEESAERVDLEVITEENLINLSSEIEY